MKKILNKIKNNILISTIIFLVIFIISKLIINVIKLEYMQWVYKTVIFISILGFIIGIIQIITKTKNRKFKIFLETLFAIGIVICIVFFQLFALFYALAFKPEHIVQKDGQILVAYVRAFKRTYVDYYEFVNPFVRSTNLVLNEYYGKGGFDPIENKEHSVESYTYYDKN